jgi:nucleotide-binding universal stress UspA family protein
MGAIVVGVDGSDHSKDALRWAVDEARRRDCRVRAVIAWSPPYVLVGLEATMAVPMDAAKEGATTKLESVVAEVVTDAADRARVDLVVAPGNAVPVLVDESKAADLLVVGSRGYGGFLGLLLGSTADQVVKHTQCPTVVVR